MREDPWSGAVSAGASGAARACGGTGRPAGPSFGLEHGPVGPGHQVRQRGAVAGLAGGPAEGHVDRGTDELRRRRVGEMGLRCGRMTVAQSASRRSQRQHEELGAADAGQDVALAEGRPTGRAPRPGARRRRRGARGARSAPARCSTSTKRTWTSDVLAVGELQQAVAGDEQAPAVLEAGQLVAPRQLQQAGAQLLDLALDGEAPGRCRAGCCRIWTAPSAVTELSASSSRCRPSGRRPGGSAPCRPTTRPVPLGHRQPPAGVLVVDQAGHAEPADLVGGRGRAWRRRPGWRR